MKSSSYRWDFSAVLEYQQALLDAIQLTLTLAALTIILAIAFGLILSLGRSSRSVLLRVPVTGLVEVVRAVPSLVTIVWMYYCIPIITGFSPTAFHTAIIALSLYSSVFYCEIFRGGIQSIEKGHIEAGLSVGMTRFQIFRRITGPLALQRISPPLISQCVLVIKNTSLVGYIAVSDILYTGQQISINTFRPLEILTIVAGLFATIILPLTFLANALESRARRRYYT